MIIVCRICGKRHTKHDRSARVMVGVCHKCFKRTNAIHRITLRMVKKSALVVKR